MSKLRYKENGEWKSIAPSQKEFDDNKNAVASQLADTTSKLIDITVLMSSFPLIAGETSDTLRIQRAVDYCISNNIGHLHFNRQTSTYKLTSRVLIKNANNLLITSDKSVKIQFSNNVTTTNYTNMLLFEIEKSTNITFDGVSFYGNKVGQSTPHASAFSYYQALYISGSEKISVINCSFKNHFGYAIIINYDNWYTNSSSDYTVMSQYKGVYGMVIRGNQMIDCHGGAQFICSDTKDVKITNNVIDTTGEHGLSFYPYENEILIEGNTFKNIGDVGIRCYENYNVVITNNIIDGFKVTGIAADTNLYSRICKNLTINHNVIRNFVSGKTTTNSAIGMVANNSSISNNVLENIGYRGIVASGQNIIVNTNVIKNFTQDGVSLGGKVLTGLVNDNINVNMNSILNDVQAYAGVYFNVPITQIQIIKNNISNVRRKIQSFTGQLVFSYLTLSGTYNFNNIAGSGVNFKAPPIVMAAGGHVMAISYNIIGDLGGGVMIFEMYKNGVKTGFSKQVNTAQGITTYPYGVVDDSADNNWFLANDVIEFSVRPFNTSSTFTVTYNYIYELV